MSARRCQNVEVDGIPVIAYGPRLTGGDRAAIREFQEVLRARGPRREMANPWRSER